MVEDDMLDIQEDIHAGVTEPSSEQQHIRCQKAEPIKEVKHGAHASQHWSQGFD